MSSRNAFTCLGLVVVLSAATAAASEKSVRRADVPEPVLAAIAARYPSATLTRFAKETERGATLYEVVVDVGSVHAEVSLTPEGKIVSEEATITMKDLPEAVRKSLSASRYRKAEVRRVERVTDANMSKVTAFERMVEQAGKLHELVFDEMGDPTKTE
jgi:hypothetical protein